MRGFFDPSVLARTYRDPLALFGLLIDLVPLVAIIVFGWGLDELVIYYWIENLIIGVGVWLRLATQATLGRRVEAWFLIVFFPVHYGLFCAVHGMILLDLFDPSFTALPLFLAASISWEAALFARGFIGEGRHRRDAPSATMFAPYGRIVIVHIAIFAAAFAAEALGSPAAGAVAILALDILWGVALSVARQRGRGPGAQQVDAKVKS